MTSMPETQESPTQGATVERRFAVRYSHTSPFTSWVVAVGFGAMLLCAGQASLAAGCGAVWKRHPGFKPVSVPVLQNVQLPEDGIIEGIEINTLIGPDGGIFIPENLQESICALDRMFGPEVRAAIRAAALEWRRTEHSRDVDLQMQHLFDAIDAQLYKRYGHGGLHPDLGAITLRIQLAWRLGLDGGNVENPTTLQRVAYGKGIYWNEGIATWVLLAYVRQFGGHGVDVGRIEAVFRKGGAAFAPPTTLTPKGCTGGIQYHWPRTTVAFEDVPEEYENDDVHWGMCTSTGKLWAYHYRMGWRVATALEVKRVCEIFLGDSWVERACDSDEVK